MTALDYFRGEELPASVFLDKYALRDRQDNLAEDNPDQMHRRIARELARVESSKFKEPYSEEFIYGLLKDFGYIIPQGGPMYGIGNPQYVTLSNCFVTQPPIDSYGGVHLADEQLTQICKRRGGVGTDVSHIRPDGVPTTNAARRATGVVPFCERFSNSIREVAQKGRRGALMLTISVHHPQVLDFATMKMDKTKVTGANVSIRLSNEFLNAVERDEDYEQRWPVDSVQPEISRKVNAREVWRKIVECAWARAEPGLLFWDLIVSECPADCYAHAGFRTVSTNPCQSANALLLTPKGLRRLGDVTEGDVVWGRDGWVTVTSKWPTGTKPVYRFRTTSGIFYGTDRHRVVCRGEKVEAVLADSIDVLAGPATESFRGQWDPRSVMDGLVIGDGSYHAASRLVFLHVGGKDGDYFTSEVAGLIGKKRSALGDFAYEVDTGITAQQMPKTFLRRIPERYLTASTLIVASFLRGLYSANGSVCRDRVTLKTSSPGLAEDVQVMLSSIGIRSYVTTNKPHRVRFFNGEYECKESYDINITSDREKFRENIGFLHGYKCDKLDDVIGRVESSPTHVKRSHEVVSVEFVAEEEVFDITVSGPSHTYWTGGCDVSNCSELNLCVLDSCRLLLLNLFSYVVNPFGVGAYFGFDKFYEHAQVAQRLMDDIVDLELECIDRILAKVESDPEPGHVKQRELDMWREIRAKCLNGRRTGTGITALGDAMAAVGVRYGSEESVAFADRVYKTLKFGCYRASVDMVKGGLTPFPVWDRDAEADCPFLLRMKCEEVVLGDRVVSGRQLFEEMRKCGRRNIALLTTAPAGSVSILAGPGPYYGTTSGIEPLFTDAPYTRRKKIVPGVTNARVDFVDELGDQWSHFEVFHPKLRLWMEMSGERDWTKSPYRGCTANDLDWRPRVRLQAAAQRHVDHAISSTVNLPKDVTIEQVAEVYETAWKAGCKGITVYRDGCRDGVLVKETKTAKTQAAKRPASVSCDIHHTKVQKKPFIVVVGLLGGDPYEVFAFANDESRLGKSTSVGSVRKAKRGKYELLSPDGDNLLPGCDSLTSLLSDTEEALTRMVSTSLRHGADISFVVQQLEKSKGDLHGYGRALARVLKKYVKDGTKVSGEQCESCKQEGLVRQEGCVTCRSCGWSKCT